jgi:hypothetical protein
VRVIALIGLLVYTCGAFAYAMTLVFWFREISQPVWLQRRSASKTLAEIDIVNGAMLIVSLLWFCVNAAATFLQLGPRLHLWQLDVCTVFLAFAFPPLIMHTSWAEVALVPHHGPRALPGRAWRAMLWPVYGAALAVPVASVAVFLNASPSGALYRDVGRVLGLSQVVLFVTAAIYSMALISRQPARASRERQEQRSLLGLFALMAVLFLVLFASWIPGLGGRRNQMAAMALLVLEIATKSLPLIFIFVGAYFENRFDFVDLFVKRAVALVASVAVLAAGFAVMLPLLRRIPAGWMQPWLYAFALLPAAAALPWVHGHIAAVLDRRWLGRRFTSVEAIKRFLTALKSATNEAQAIERAREGLAEIFDATCDVQLYPVERAEQADAVPIQSGDAPLGQFLMGPRGSEARYFSEDVELLASLADVFASVLVNLRFQEKRKEQEQRAQELSLHASRSELKALRAQINPHFLFNALNAIAGLIQSNPRAADRTIEQLADVFRYALRGAESEWAALGDEADFVLAYLQVERARFGDRLEVDVRIADAVRRARVPTMAVQTLVENAVKHGLSELRGRAVVRVDATRHGDRLTVAVSDNGPGFSARARSDVDAAPAARGGYGLSNVRQRLHGYFGDNAALVIERDHARDETVVSLQLPLLLDTVTRADAHPPATSLSQDGDR